jgi:hypothetical protein
MSLKLGRKPPDYTKSRLWLEDYVTPASWPKFSPVVDRASKVTQWPMYLNDTYGDCTIAGMGHLYGALTAYAHNTEAIFNNSVVEAVYERNCPTFNPSTGAGDDGCTLQGVLADQVSNGMADMFGTVHNVVAYAQMKSIGPRWLAVALEAFGSVYLGVNLPQSAETQFSAGQPWTYVQGSPILGGHCIVLQAVHEAVAHPSQSGNQAFTFVTWGSTVTASWQWCNTYIEEAWVAISQDWLQANGTTVEGFDLAQLQADMTYVGG